MRRGQVLALAATAATALVCAAPNAAAASSRVRVGSAPRHPAHSRVTGGLPNSTRIELTVALKPRDPAALAAYAEQVSTPGSGVYRHYLTVAQFRARFGPTAEQVRTVEASLLGGGLRPGPVSANGLAIPVTSSAGTVGHAFALSFQKLALAGGRTAFANTRAPQFPSAVADVVQGVVGLDTLSVPQPLGLKRRSAPSQHAAGRLAPAVVTGGPQPCTSASSTATEYGSYTADQIASAYNFSSLYGAGDEGAGQTIALFELEPNSTSDIAAYQSCYGTSATVTYDQVDGGASGSQSGEAALDIEDVIGLAPKANVLVYQGPNSGAGAFDTYNAIVSQDTAKVVSTSWGLCESLDGSTDAGIENSLFAEAATQGQSVFAAAGDTGSEDCRGANGLAVDDPASQPYVTGVGGTTLSSLGPPPTQAVWNNRTEGESGGGAGGGGISTVWPMPTYQSGAPSSLNVINSYSSGTPCGASSGSYCREVPDVSADADPYTGYVIYFGGSWTVYGGTSAAAPLWAAFTALVNASSDCNGSNIGFANPLLYTAAASGYSSDFDDVTTGNNDWTGTNSGDYPAGTGYDLATGLGTPNGANLPTTLCNGGGGGSGNTVTVQDPGNQSTEAGTFAQLQIDASDSDSTQTLTYLAANLPPGLTINSSSGLISGTPSAVGSFTVIVRAKDSTAAFGTTSFTWTVSQVPTSTSVTCAPTSVQIDRATTCTATVTNTDGSTATPTGSVVFTSGQGGAFSGSGSCGLAQASPGRGRCAVSYSPTTAGAHAIFAGYNGDTVHTSSAGSFTSYATSYVPHSTGAVTISGTPQAGSRLRCSPGPWSYDPTRFDYQWNRDGTPIVDANSSGYTVQVIDEASTLSCTVTATNAAGSGSPATSAGVHVPVAVVAGCPAPTGTLSGKRLGSITLGNTRRQTERANKRSSRHHQRYEDFFCLTPIGVRVGYASPKLLAAAPASVKRSLRKRVIWISTSDPVYAIDGVRAGATLATAAGKLKLGKVFHVGRNDWYLAPAGPATAVLKVRGGIVEEVGIATRRLTATRSQQRTFLTSFS